MHQKRWWRTFALRSAVEDLTCACTPEHSAPGSPLVCHCCFVVVFTLCPTLHTCPALAVPPQSAKVAWPGLRAAARNLLSLHRIRLCNTNRCHQPAHSKVHCNPVWVHTMVHTYTGQGSHQQNVTHKGLLAIGHTCIHALGSLLNKVCLWSPEPCLWSPECMHARASSQALLQTRLLVGLTHFVYPPPLPNVFGHTKFGKMLAACKPPGVPPHPRWFGRRPAVHALSTAVVCLCADAEGTVCASHDELAVQL